MKGGVLVPAVASSARSETASDSWSMSLTRNRSYRRHAPTALSLIGRPHPINRSFFVSIFDFRFSIFDFRFSIFDFRFWRLKKVH